MTRRLLITAIAFFWLLSGCALIHRQKAYTIKLKKDKLEQLAGQLTNASPSYFNHSYTTVVLVDSRACGMGIAETKWWSKWQQHMDDNGIGFVLVTSPTDSMDLVVVAELDSVSAPVLVLPSYEHDLEGMGYPRNGVPLHILIDSNAAVLGYWAPQYEFIGPNKFVFAIDSLVNSSSR